MAQLPIQQIQDRVVSLVLTRWKALIDPILKNPQSQGTILKGVALKNGVTVINHLLDRQMQGWSIVDISAAATIYRSAPFNELTLTLTSNAAVTVNIEVF